MNNILGIVLLIVPNRKVKKAANVVLLLAKVLNLYSHFAIDDPFERMAPTLVFFFMLVCRMVVDWQFVKSTQEQVYNDITFLIMLVTILFLGCVGGEAAHWQL